MAAPGVFRRKPVVPKKRILKILAKQGISSDQVTFIELERVLREYRQLHPDAHFGREERAILARSDWALRNQALFREKWSEAKLLAVNPEQWQDFARRFGEMSTIEAEAWRSSGTFSTPFVIYGDHLRCQWTSSRDDELGLRFDILAADAGRHLGESTGIQQSLRQTDVGSWADFWKYCLWFYLGESRTNTISDPLKTSVKFCLHLALHSESIPRQASGIALLPGSQHPRSPRRPTPSPSASSDPDHSC